MAALTVSPASLSFTSIANSLNPPAQAISITFSGSPTAYTISSDSAWLIALPGSGTTPGVSQVSVMSQGLQAGTYQGNLTVATTVVPVTFVVQPNLAVTDTYMLNDIIYRVLENGAADAAGTLLTSMFSVQQIVDCMNRVQQDFLLQTGMVLTRTTIPGQVNVNQYPMPSNSIRPRRVTWQDVNL